MKSLELSLNKRLLIVEREFHTINGSYSDNGKMHTLKLICKGSDLTEEIAKGLVEQKRVFDTPAVFFFKNYKNEFSDCMTARESFISSIESNGWYWGENPEKKSHFNPEEFIQEEYDRYMEAESRTFKPSKCIICEIL